jgi:hypothetical protein
MLRHGLAPPGMQVTNVSFKPLGLDRALGEQVEVSGR